MRRTTPVTPWTRKLGALLVTLATLGILTAPATAGEWVHPFDFPQDEDAPDEFYAVIEIPAGGFTKYEIDGDTGHVMVDRYVSMPVAYPANYGSICQTLGGDDDPLDVLVLSREPIAPGAIIKLRPVGVPKSIDGGEVDDKILAVPTTKLDPTYEEIQDIADIPAAEKERISQFFQVYKRMNKKVIEVKGWGDAAAAREMLQKALDSYKARSSGGGH